MTFIVFHIHLCCALGIWGKASRAQLSNKTTFPWGSARGLLIKRISTAKHWGTGFVCRSIGHQCLVEPTCTHKPLQGLHPAWLRQSSRDQSTPCPEVGCPHSGAGASSSKIACWEATENAGTEATTCSKCQVIPVPPHYSLPFQRAFCFAGTCCSQPEARAKFLSSLRELMASSYPLTTAPRYKPL